MSIAKTHQNYSHHWWTPQPWLDWVQATLGDYHDMCPRDWEGMSDKERPEVNSLAHFGHKPVYCNHPGERGSTARWWGGFEDIVGWSNRGGIWCAFNIEQFRHMNPSPFDIDGWLVMPKKRIGFVWGGPTVEPAETPEECVIVRTGT